MSTSYDVIGMKVQDEKWEKMKNVWNTCRVAGIDVPEEVETFFDWNNPNEMHGMQVDISNAISQPSLEEYVAWDVDIDKLPPDIKVVRFRISY